MNGINFASLRPSRAFIHLGQTMESSNRYVLRIIGLFALKEYMMFDQSSCIRVKY